MATSSTHLQPRKTTSTCTSETVRGTHQFRIVGYSKNKGLGFGEFIRSGNFVVAGHRWAVAYYPDGFSEDQGYISVYLELMSKKTKARALFDLRLVDQTTGLSCSVFRQAQPVVFYKITKRVDESYWGVRTFMKRSELEASAYLRDDSITIECVVEVVQEPKRSFTELPVLDLPPMDILQHLGKLLEGGEAADVKFYVGGETFAAHKVVLAMRSPVFKAEFYGPMKEKDAARLTIDDIQPAVFKALLHFIYTDSLLAMDDLDGGDKKEMVCHLLVAADRYGMERLKRICECLLCECLNVHTVAATLDLADQHFCNKLKNACLQFVISSHK